MTMWVVLSVAFGEWLDAEIKERCWSRNEFARRVRVDSGLVSRWVDGSRTPQRRSCEAIAEALEVPVQVVLEAAGRKVRYPEVPDDLDFTDPLLDFFAHNMDKLSPEDRKELLLFGLERIRQREG